MRGRSRGRNRRVGLGVYAAYACYSHGYVYDSYFDPVPSLIRTLVANTKAIATASVITARLVNANTTLDPMTMFTPSPSPMVVMAITIVIPNMVMSLLLLLALCCAISSPGTITVPSACTSATTTRCSIALDIACTLGTLITKTVLVSWQCGDYGDVYDVFDIPLLPSFPRWLLVLL